MKKIIIKHLTGSRSNQVDEFPVTGPLDLTIGRDATADVRLDADRDDLVSHRHACIMAATPDTEGFDLVDMQSRNGTFLNHQRVYGTAYVRHGDIVQLGAGGPEFRLETDPPPQPTARPTTEASLAASAASGAKATRVTGVSSIGMTGSSRPVGRATVERMLGDAFLRVKMDSRKLIWLGITAVFAILAVGGSVRYYLRQSELQQERTQEQNILALQRMNEELKKNPVATEAMKQQIQGLEAELRQSDEHHRKVLQALLQEINSRTNAHGAVATNSSPDNKSGVPSSSGPREQMNSAAQTYNSLLDQARRQFQQGQPRMALELAQQAIQNDKTHWEAYEVAGQAAGALGDYDTALLMCRNALRLAPAVSRQEILDRMEDLQPRMVKQ